MIKSQVCFIEIANVKLLDCTQACRKITITKWPRAPPKEAVQRSP